LVWDHGEPEANAPGTFPHSARYRRSTTEKIEFENLTTAENRAVRKARERECVIFL